MKNYLKFDLKGREFFGIWVLFYFLFVFPYAYLVMQLQLSANNSATQMNIPWLGLIFMVVLVFVALIFLMYFVKIIIEKIGYNNDYLVADYSVGRFFSIILPGIILSVITLGIYLPWFIKRLTNFFVDNTSYKGNPFSFRGKGLDLFIIITVTLVVPIALIAYMLFKFFNTNSNALTGAEAVLYQVAYYFVMIPYTYLTYKWFVDVKYKDYHIRWNTVFLPSVGKIALELFLSLITAGIYAPLACLRIYKYFIHKTCISCDGGICLSFGFDEDFFRDFLFIWGQILLTAITAGLYYPWALSKIGTRIIGKTYIANVIDN